MEFELYDMLLIYESSGKSIHNMSIYYSYKKSPSFMELIDGLHNDGLIEYYFEPKCLHLHTVAELRSGAKLFDIKAPRAKPDLIERIRSSEKCEDVCKLLPKTKCYRITDSYKVILWDAFDKDLKKIDTSFLYTCADTSNKAAGFLIEEKDYESAVLYLCISFIARILNNTSYYRINPQYYAIEYHITGAKGLMNKIKKTINRINISRAEFDNIIDAAIEIEFAHLKREYDFKKVRGLIDECLYGYG